MITGYNTDVKHDGKVFHVQTEDKGVGNPVLETLVYVSGGQIIASKQYSYATLVKDGKCDEKLLAELLESQHRRVMRWIQGGKFDEQGPPPFGATIVSSRTFDEVVLEFLESQLGDEPIEITPSGELKPVAGSDLELRLLIKSALTGAPVPGAKVKVSVRAKGSAPEKVFAGSAGPDGKADGTVTLPAGSKGGFLMLEARLGTQVATLEARIG